MVALRAFTGAGSIGLTTLPNGRSRLIGLKQPAFVGMFGSVTARMAKKAGAREPDGTALNGPVTWDEEPVKSQWNLSSPTVTATSKRIGLSRWMPSLSL